MPVKSRRLPNAFIVLEPLRLQSDFELQFSGEPQARGRRRGRRLHVAFAVLWCFLVAWPTSIVELGGIPLIVMFLLRSPRTWRSWAACFLQPVSLMVACWAVVQAASLSWSPDPAQGLREMGSLRWVWVFIALWSVLDRRPLLIGALAAGFLVGNLVQLGHFAGAQAGIGWLDWGRAQDRYSGWWDPVVGGSLLVGALGLHLPAALMGRGRARTLGAAGAIATALGILATGTRGAWLAGAALVALAVLFAIARIRPRRRLLVPLGIGAAVLALSVGLAWLWAGDSILRRTELARDEVARAIYEEDYQSDTGARILMWSWALEAWRRHPALGVGAGGYRAWVVRQRSADGLETPADLIHSHAHSAPLHIAATTGTLGLLVAALLIAVGVRGGAAGLGAESAGYGAGPALAIVGLVLAGAFDAVHINAQSAALLATLLALCLHPRPHPPRMPPPDRI